MFYRSAIFIFHYQENATQTRISSCATLLKFVLLLFFVIKMYVSFHVFKLYETFISVQPH